MQCGLCNLDSIDQIIGLPVGIAQGHASAQPVCNRKGVGILSRWRGRRTGRGWGGRDGCGRKQAAEGNLLRQPPRPRSVQLDGQRFAGDGIENGRIPETGQARQIPSLRDGSLTAHIHPVSGERQARSNRKRSSSASG